MSICAVWHASWTVRDMDVTLPFYTDLLGLEIMHSQIQDNEYTRQLVGIEDAVLRVEMLRIPGPQQPLSGHIIELVQYLSPAGATLDTKPCNVGASHFAFVSKDVHAVYEKLTAHGVRFVSPPAAITAGLNKGGFTCYFKDPDGYILEMMQPPEWRFAEQKPVP